MAAAAVLRSEVYQSLFPTEHYNVFVNKGLRPDGRALAEARRAAAQVGVVAAAAASASVQIGGTLVIAGAALELAVPDDASPDSGRLQTQVRWKLCAPQPARQCACSSKQSSSGKKNRRTQAYAVS